MLERRCARARGSRTSGLFSFRVLLSAAMAALAWALAPGLSAAQPVGRIPILFIMLEIGPGTGQDFETDRGLDFWRALLDGASPANTTSNVDVIDYEGGFAASPGHFPNSRNFPDPNNRIADLALSAEATIIVSPTEAGPWSIGVRSDDGAIVKIDGETVVDNDGRHAPTDAIETVNLTLGSHTLELVYFNAGATPGLVELFAAKGSGLAAFSNAFNLVGSGAPGALSVSSEGFTVRYRHSRNYVASLAQAERLMRAPYHDVVGYFAENSNGALSLVPAIGGDTVDGSPDGIVHVAASRRPTTLVSDANEKRRVAMETAAADFDFAFYDAPQNGGNGNGQLDRNELAVVVVTGQPDGDRPCGNTRGPDKAFSVDGLDVSKSYPVAALTQWCRWITLVHEISHVLSDEARDLYNLTGSGSDLPPYDVMASGDRDDYTAHHNPWTKMRMGWLGPKTIQTTGVYKIDAIEQAADALRIEKPGDASEYLLIENRWSPGSYDDSSTVTDFPAAPPALEFRPEQGIPADGLAIYHVDEKRLGAFDGNDFKAPIFLKRLVPPAGGLWDGRSSFHDHHWNDGAPSYIAVTCISNPGPRVSAAIQFNVTTFPYDDRFEIAGPNNDPEHATGLSLGVEETGLSIHAACDLDYFRFTLADYSDVEVTTVAYSDPQVEQETAGPDLELFRDGDSVAAGKAALALKQAVPGDYILKVSSSSPLYYRLLVESTPSTIKPDRFDDQQPPGEPRNDVFADAALLALKLGPVQPSIELNLPWRVEKGGRGVSIREPALNFDLTADVDYFEISVDLASFAYPPGGGGECPADLGSGLAGFATQEQKGMIRIALYPDLPGALDLEVTDAAGGPLPKGPYMRPWANEWSTGIEIDCPTANLATWPSPGGRGVLIARVSDPQRRHNFYELHVDYREAELFGVDRDAFPHPVWDLEDTKVLWPQPAPDELVFPFDPRACVSAQCPQAIDRAIFYWPEFGNLDLTVKLPGLAFHVVRLFGPQGPVSDAIPVRGQGRISVPNLPAGIYLVQVDGERGPEPGAPPPREEPKPQLHDFQVSTMPKGQCVAGQVCDVETSIANVGEVSFPGTLELRGVIDPSVSIRFVDETPDGLNCRTLGGGRYACRGRPSSLGPGESSRIQLKLLLPVDLQTTRLAHSVQLIWPPGKQDANPANDVARFTIRVISCQPGQAWDGRQCVDRCEPSQRWDGRRCVDRCQPSQAWDGRRCVERCQPSQHWDGRRCVDRCQPGQAWDGRRCVDRCQPSQAWDGRRCVDRCQPSQAWDGRRCVDRCQPGQAWDGRRCVDRCPSGQRWDGRQCISICLPPFRWNGQFCVPPPCPAPKRWDGQRCACPSGTTEIGGLCVRQPPPVQVIPPAPLKVVPPPAPLKVVPLPQPPCPDGQVRVRGLCVCPSDKPVWTGSQCIPRLQVIPMQVCPPGTKLVEGKCMPIIK